MNTTGILFPIYHRMVAFTAYNLLRKAHQSARVQKYTRILLPLFVFILCADVFFPVHSVIEGRLFRGWVHKKQAGESR